MVTIDQVPMFAVMSGIGHVLMRTNGDMEWWACGTVSWGSDKRTPKRPARICRKCRAALKDIVNPWDKIVEQPKPDIQDVVNAATILM